MSATIILTPDRTGAVDTAQLAAIAEEASCGRKFLCVWAHGLGTDFVGFSDLSDTGVAGIDARRAELGLPEADCLIVMVHWQSALTENDGSPLNILASAGYWTMEDRADVIGRTAVLNALQTAMIHNPTPMKIIGIGHSFGCKVIASGFAELAKENVTIPPGTKFHAHLLQGAFPHDSLQADKCYGAMRNLPLTLTTTRSDLDKALGTWFPDARLLEGKPARALGFAGVTVQTLEDWGADRIVQDDLTGYHREHDVEPWKSAAGGHHDHVCIPSVYDAILDELV